MFTSILIHLTNSNHPHITVVCIVNILVFDNHHISVSENEWGTPFRKKSYFLVWLPTWFKICISNSQLGSDIHNGRLPHGLSVGSKTWFEGYLILYYFQVCNLVRHMTNYTFSEMICSEELNDNILFYLVDTLQTLWI